MMSVDRTQPNSNSDDDSPHGAQDAAEAAKDTSSDSPVPSTETLHDAPSRLPNQIGRYHVKRVIASGGMGTVYEAVQEHPRRTVAVKVMRHGIASRSAMRRFEYESQILARLRHPGIAQVYEAGTHTPSPSKGEGWGEGQLEPVPFFAMEYIPNAKPITKYATEKKLGTRERLDLFGKVCDAVHHGHQKGIIHRDLKPSNILVDSHGQPRIIDFGVARATDSDMAVTTLQTDVGQLIGTMQYMSPEQCEADPHDLDTRSDVYALGVVLYELLCRKLPYDVSKVAVYEATRMVREHQPTRLSTIDRALRGDVETIVLKALEKDRERRYQSAIELNQDIKRYLTGEAIIARPPSIVYQLRVFARRNKAFFSAVSAAFVVLVAGVIVSTSLYFRSEIARRDAVQAREAESRQRALADERYEEIIRLADLKRLADAKAAADELGPAHPEKIEAMETWLKAQAAPLRDNLPKHEATLVSLRNQALEYNPGQQKRDRETHPKAAELAEQKQRLAELQKELDDARAEESEDAVEKAKRIEELEKSVAGSEKAITALEESVKERRTWEFADDDTQWQHDTLAGLVQGLRDFVNPDPKRGTLASVQERLESASNIKQQSIAGPQAAARWAEAIANIAQLEVYGGLQLTPQIGLLPLRRDPRSGLWEFWHIQTGTKPEEDPDNEAVNPWVLTGDTGLVFVLIPGGTFWMGAQKDDPEGHNYDTQARANESPVHEVTLAPFFISKYEMTQGQWRRFTGENPSQYDPSWRDDPPAETPIHQNELWNPVEQVTWTDCRDVLDGLGLVLPTEAQWEYAARAGTDSVWWTGNEKESVVLEGAGNLGEDWLEDSWVVHAPVGSFRANGFGLHDVIGNVWEWCRDGYGGYDADVNPGNGLRKVTGARSRADRGGAFTCTAAHARSARRGGSSGTSEFRFSDLGVRPARVITE